MSPHQVHTIRQGANRSPDTPDRGPCQQGPTTAADRGDAINDAVTRFLSLNTEAQREALYEWMRSAPAFACALVLHLGWQLDPSVREWGARNGRIAGGLALQELRTAGLVPAGLPGL
jgi:hypothetical protein